MIDFQFSSHAVPGTWGVLGCTRVSHGTRFSHRLACVPPLPAAPSPPSWAPGWTSTQRISASPQTSPASSSSSPTCTTTSPAQTWNAEPASCWPSSSSKSRASPKQKVGSFPHCQGVVWGSRWQKCYWLALTVSKTSGLATWLNPHKPCLHLHGGTLGS